MRTKQKKPKKKKKKKKKKTTIHRGTLAWARTCGQNALHDDVADLLVLPASGACIAGGGGWWVDNGKGPVYSFIRMFPRVG